MRDENLLPPLVRPGEYRMVYVSRFTKLIFNAPKLAVVFRIIDEGEFHGVELERWYNVKRLIGKEGKNGAFTAKKSGDFLHEYATLFPSAMTRDQRLDRISFTPMVSAVITGRVITVTKDYMQRNKPEVLYTSTIRPLIKAGA